MRLGKLCLAAAAACASLATAAQAAITATWVASNPTAAAIANDATLANHQSWLLRITNTDGDWSSAGLQVQLSGAGTGFYNNSFGGNTLPNPALISAFPALEFDTYVTSPTDNGTNGATNVLGGFPVGGATLTGNVFTVSWGDLATSAPGTYTIARLTFPNAQIPNTINAGELPPPNQAEGSFTSQVNPDGFALIPEIIIPEPGAMSLLALSGLVAMRRRS